MQLRLIIVPHVFQLRLKMHLQLRLQLVRVLGRRHHFGLTYRYKSVKMSVGRAARMQERTSSKCCESGEKMQATCQTPLYMYAVSLSSVNLSDISNTIFALFSSSTAFSPLQSCCSWMRHS